MSDAPERIYLNLGNEETTYAEAVDAGWEVSWCEDQQDEWDVEYVRVDLYEQLQEEVERLRFIVRHLPEICETGVVPTAVAYVAAKMTKAELGALAQARGIGKSNSKRGDQ